MTGALLALLASAISPAAAPVAVPCALPAGWSEIVGKAPHYVIFGELHGSAQSAAMFGETVCALAARRERLLVAVELGDDAGLQRAWALPDADFAKSLPVLIPEWMTRKDGVTSQAVFAMLVRLHALKVAGRAIDIVAFNGLPDESQKAQFKDLPGQGPHEATQADNIRRADARHRHDRVLILVGGYHARKKPLTFAGTTYDPMAMKLAPAARIVTLNMAYGDGPTWNCQLKGTPKPGAAITSDMVECGPHDGHGNVDWIGAPRLVALKGADQSVNPDGAYDGAYFVGPVTASPPIGHDQ